ncbi:MAG: phosphoenolpyruvate carboxykinase [Candidatus Methanofastidiosum methylothiophilum]|uniref:Phosphoenolpyruvate carboxykinase n=1 Tax=Candidatus Methanofastidiosum methylothiophilum TaxID=1705564 RepID=A0A150ILG9_9EURY|nr:MAG: phosphoenolpyruvate carboxykinase [Candidatus Methanofastidiosum methylthiophilus]KYC47758.1 MAG: phosphoenolpyruvate carboxykinase [Candidatus Methanofastidiosum methylthiophilus]KYC50529.1 MAG: phosphoenolpyruvate carboxykinase [Candidatus Methanofastidiosum methylthiophilus]
MSSFNISKNLILPKERIFLNPSDEFYINYLKPYYVITKDGQYLFASTQKGRRPDQVHYMVPKEYKLGSGQKGFDIDIGKEVYRIVMEYLREIPNVIVSDGIQGENGYEVGIRSVVSIENPHSAYISWMGKMMVFPPKEEVEPSCYNFIIPEKLPEEYSSRIKKVWPDYNENEPLSLYDFTEMENDIRCVINLGIDYFGGAFKKPNLTMVWNKGESDNMISFHAGLLESSVIIGLSGTGKTTLTVGPNLEQDDAVLGKVIKKDDKIVDVKLVGLEAASFAKSEGMSEKSPEYPGLMKSRDRKHIVLAMNIDCEGVDYVKKNINGYDVEIPVPTSNVGSLLCKSYEKSKTTNGRFIFLFSDLNSSWGKMDKYLRNFVLSFKRYDIFNPIVKVTNPLMAVAFDSACESIITSAISGKVPGTRVRSYSATDFMAREQAEQAVLKKKVFNDMGLGQDGKINFLIINTGFVGEFDLNGKSIGGEKITVSDSKTLLKLSTHGLIKNWIKDPVYGYLIPSPKELSEVHGMKNFGERFNPLNYYSPHDYLEFVKIDIKERKDFLYKIFASQKNYPNLEDVIGVWDEILLPSPKEIKKFYDTYYS